jgi:hypothetical protein
MRWRVRARRSTAQVRVSVKVLARLARAMAWLFRRRARERRLSSVRMEAGRGRVPGRPGAVAAGCAAAPLKEGFAAPAPALPRLRCRAGLFERQEQQAGEFLGAEAVGAGGDDEFAELGFLPGLVTPAKYAGQLDAVMERAHQAGSKAAWDAKAQLDNAVRRVEHLTGTVSTHEEQRRWRGVALACGVMLGIALWYVLPSLLPWGAGDWLASSLIGGGRWRAGEALMERASPASFERMVQLYNACGERPIDLCETALTAGGADAEPHGTSPVHRKLPP